MQALSARKHACSSSIDRDEEDTLLESQLAHSCMQNVHGDENRIDAVATLARGGVDGAESTQQTSNALIQSAIATCQADDSGLLWAWQLT
jgi:K+/H+ antiporter YhaU regulatory subunit KhtT